MTSPRPETTDRTAKIEDKDTDKDEAKGLQLSATQVAAGALASVSSAVVASFFGLAGTLIGAALASVISTVSAALYSSSLRKTNEKLRTARNQLTGRQSPVADTRVAPATPATRVLPAHLDPRRAPARRPRPRWTRVAVYAAAVFVMAMGVITGIELIGQKPVSALVGGTQTSQETTLGAITNASSSSDVQQEEEPSSPSSPTTAPATGTSAPTAGSEEESTSSDEDAGEDETSDGDETASATPTRTSKAQPTTSSEPTGSSQGSSEQDSSQDSSSEEDSSPATGAEPTP